MSAERELERVVRSWLREDGREDADRVLNVVLTEVDSTPQRRATWWPVRRFRSMNNVARLAVAGVTVIAVAVLGYGLLGRSVGGQPDPTATSSPTGIPSPSVSESPPPPLTLNPFSAGGFGMCPPETVSSDCTEDAADDSMTFTFQIPDGWEGNEIGAQPSDDGFGPPAGAFVYVNRGNWLHSDPCLSDEEQAPDIPVGPTVEDFATALATHPLLEVTSPVDVTLAGYSGKYLELQVPADITECVQYRPMNAGIYAQGPDNRWRFWILDVQGIRAVIQVSDFPDTSQERKAEALAIVESVQIEP